MNTFNVDRYTKGMGFICGAAFLIIISLGVLGACRSPEKLLQLAQDRGAVIVADTAWQTRTIYDTIIDPNTGSVEVIERVDSIPYPVEVVKFIPLTRQERLALKDEFKHVEKMQKLKIKELSDSLKYLDKENKRTAANYGDSLKYERDKHKATEKTNKKAAKGSPFWTWIGKRWWLFLIIGFFIRQLLPVILKVFGINWPLIAKK